MPTAVFEGADAVMLSYGTKLRRGAALTVEAVATMDPGRPRRGAGNQTTRAIIEAQRYDPEPPPGRDALSAAARQDRRDRSTCAQSHCYTTVGLDGDPRVAGADRSLHPLRPLAPTVARRAARHRLGPRQRRLPRAEELDDFIAYAGEIAVDIGLARTGDRLLAVAGLPLHTPGVTNFLQLAFVRSSDER